MRTTRVIHTVSCHAGGEVGDVIVGGVAPPPGETIWEQSRWIARDGALRNFMLNEPRGGVFRHANLLVPPKHPDATIAWIIMEPEDTPPMSGSNAICVATVALETGIVPMSAPETHFAMEAPGGLVRVCAQCRNGKAESVTIENLPSFACDLDVALDVPGIGALKVDTAYGGDSFVVVDAAALGFEIAPREAKRLADLGRIILDAANGQLTFDHPKQPDWGHYSFVLFAGPLTRDQTGLSARSGVVIRPGKVDRSPTGTGVSARMAILRARGEMGVGDSLTVSSIIGAQFTGRIASDAAVADRAAIIPEITGTAWLTGTHQHMLDPADPWPTGYRLADTWPGEETPG